MLETVADRPSSIAPLAPAAQAARRNWECNRRHLRLTQLALIDALGEMPADFEWVYARDGSLTGLSDGVRWLGGCSVPRKAAQFMLRKAQTVGTVSCFLTPTHAAQLRAALDRMTRAQAVVALVPELDTLKMILCCDDFSADFAGHRLYFAWGANWEAELDRLLTQRSGLPTPSQFIRPILEDSAAADALVPPAQRLFADHSASRSRRSDALRKSWIKGTGRRICLVAPSHFRLWDDIGAALAHMMDEGAAPAIARLREPQSFSVLRFDSDDPASASPLALAQAAVECDAIVTPNSGRHDLPDLIPDEMPWITWVSSPRIPDPSRAQRDDALLVTEPRWKPLAIAAGWPADRVEIAMWPAPHGLDFFETPAPPGTFLKHRAAALGIICDTHPLDPPDRVSEYSSHRLLWEAIAKELAHNPLAIGDSPEDYLTSRMQQARVTDEGFDRAVFIHGLIAPAFAQGMARLLARKGFALRLHGAGWNQVDGLAQHAEGPVTSREDLARAIASSTALMHVWLNTDAHPIDAVGKPVVGRQRRSDTLLDATRDAVTGKQSAPGSSRRYEPTLSKQSILKLLKWI